MKPRQSVRYWAAAMLLLWLVVVATPDFAHYPAASIGSVHAADDRTLKSQRCKVRQDSSGWWLVSPSGERFFSLGVCMFNQGDTRDNYNPTKPSYAAFRHYRQPTDWARASLSRLEQWGFTTIGGWSDYETLQQLDEHKFWITPVLHAGSTAGVPWFDMWDEKVIRRVEEVAENNIAPLGGDPRVIGYFSDNELGWWNAIHWKMTLEQPASSGQRQQLIRLLREIYHDDWTALARDFELENANTWHELERGGMLWLKPGSSGIRTMRRFLGLAAERYYALMRDTIRKFDPQSLYLGDRYQSFYYPEVVEAARAHVDVISTNLNSNWNDGTFLASYLDTLHQLAGKPVLVSEFYMAAEENRSGNKNKSGGFPTVKSQPERAAALANTLHSLVRLPYVVGADWFQYYDEPPHGRKLDGEDFNFGLVDIDDRPYNEVTAAFSAIRPMELKAAAAKRPDAAAGVPPAPAEPFADFQPMLALKHWDRERGLIPPSSEPAVGDLYMCWNSDAIYLAAFVLDIVEPEYYRNSEIPEIDRARWSIRLGDEEAISVRTGAGKAPIASDENVRVKSLSGIYHQVRCITAVELPAARLGKQRFSPGDQIELKSSYLTHGRAYRMEWNGTFTLSEEPRNRL